MPIVITTDLVTIDPANATTGWLALAASTAPVANDDVRVEGTFALEGRITAGTMWVLAATAANLDLTINSRHIFFWMRVNTWAAMDTKANGALGISISSDVTPTVVGTSPNNGPSNSKTWYLAGANTDLTTGWVCYTVDPNSTPTLTTGTPLMNAVDRVGLRQKITGALATSTKSIAWDVIRYGTGLIVTTGTQAVPGNFFDIFTIDSTQTNAYGILTRQAGIYYGAGKLTFGTTTQTTITYFKDTDVVFIFQDFPVASTLYEFKILGLLLMKTTFEFGNYTGGLASGGVTVKGAGAAVWTYDGSNADIVTNFYDSYFSQIRRCLLNSASVMRYCTVNKFGDFTPAGATLDNVTFQNVVTTAPTLGTNALIITATAQTDVITNCQFINCNRAIRITQPGTYTFNNLLFTSNTFDVENTSTGLVTINLINGSNAMTSTNTAGGTTSIINSKVLNITGLISGSEIHIYRKSDLVELGTGTESSTTTFTYSYNADNTEIFITLIKPGYKWVRYDGLTFNSTGINIIATQQADLGYNNPT